MITVSILINGQPIFTRSARNTRKQNKKGETEYILDTNKKLYHKREKGAIELAIKMLKTIKEV